MVGQHCKTASQNCVVKLLIFDDTAKRKARDIFFVTGLWCDREDSNLWPSGSENYDAARNSMIHCDFLLVLHHYGTPNTSNIKQCVNDKNRPPVAKITAGGQLVVKKWSMRARYGAAFCLTVSPFHSGSRHNPLFAEFAYVNTIYQLPIEHSFAQGNCDKEVIKT